MYDAMMAETVRIGGHNGDEIEAYLARPLGPGPYGGVVVIHHLPGYDEATKQITRTFATHGYLALCPNLHHRFAPGADPDDASAAARAAVGVPDEQLVGDVAGAADELREFTSANGNVGVIGYCSGGRQAFLAACSLPLQAAVDCYGGYVVRASTQGPRREPVIALAGNLSCPLLGLFGAEDSAPSPHEVAELDAELTRLGKEHEFHTFPNAGHGFFAVDRPMYRPEAATEGWQKIWDFYGRHLATS